MATVTTAQIQQVYIGFLGRAADKAGLDYWVNEITNDTLTLEELRANITNAQPEYTDGYGQLSRGDLIDAVYQALFERAPDAAGKAYWETGDGAGVNVDRLIQAFIDGASTDDQAVLDNKTEVAEYYTTSAGANYSAASAASTIADVDGGAGAVAAGKALVDTQFNQGTTFTLTAGTNTGAAFTGTDKNDTFEAYLSQNEMAGGVSNSLSSADRLDGGAGIDTLHAELVDEFYGVNGGNAIDVQARTTNIENMTFEARDLATTGGVVTVDAKHMTDIDRIGSSFSDGDLVIENLTTLNENGTARNTSAITVTMDHTDNMNSDNDASDLTVYFDEDYLLSGQSTSTSQANYWLLDEDSQDYTNEPLLNIERDGVTLTIDGVAVEIRMEAAVAAAADTWEAFAAGLQARIDEMVTAGTTVLAGVTVAVDPTNTEQTFNDFGNLVTIPAITLTDSQGRDLVPTGFISPDGATGAFDIFGRFDNEQAQISNDPVSVNVELNKVGREGEGGNLTIGGKELGNAEGNGIEVFNISVLGEDDKPSNLGQILSTNGALKTLNISTAAADVSGDTHASLTVRGEAANGADASPFGGTVDTINAGQFLGDLTIGNESAAVNVQTLTATGGGDVNFNADITEADSVDSNIEYSYTTGNGTDIVTVSLDGDAVDAAGETFAVATGGGSDTINITMDSGVSQNTMVELDNLSITTTNGADTVNLDAYGNFNISTGDDSDFVRINSVDQNGNASVGSWAFGQDTGAQNFVARVLYEAELTVSFAGFEQTVSIETTAAGDFVATQATLNAAIRDAIDTNPELSKLLGYANDTGSEQLVVTSKVGGLNDLAIDVFQPQLVENNPTATQVAINSTHLADLRQGLIDTTALISDALETVAEVVTETDNLNTFYGSVDNAGVATEANAQFNNDYQTFTGGGSTDSTTGINFSSVNLGNGSNDIVVMHSNDSSANILEVTGTFGKASVVNFHDISPNDVINTTEVGNHGLDFTNILNGQVDTSTSLTGNQQSATDIALTLNINPTVLAGATTADRTNNEAHANSVNMLAYDQTVANSISFADVTATNLVAALNGDAGATVVGGLSDTNLYAEAFGATHVGNVQKHIVMIENTENRGEYKVFSLTSTLDAANKTQFADGSAGTQGNFDASSASLLGTLDFGASINFQLVGSNAWSALTTGKNLDGTNAADNGLYNDFNEYSSLNLDSSTGAGTQTLSVANLKTGADAAGIAAYEAALLAGGNSTYAELKQSQAVTAYAAGVNVVDTVANILAENTSGSAYLAGANQIALSDYNNEVITLTGLDADTAGTAIDFADNAVSITVAQMQSLSDGTTTWFTAADVVTLADTGTNIAALAATGTADTVDLGELATAGIDAIDLSDDAITLDVTKATAIDAGTVQFTSGDVVTVEAADATTVTVDNIKDMGTGVTVVLDDTADNAITMTAADYTAAFDTAGLTAAADDTITVSAVTGTIAATAAIDVLDMANATTALNITGFTTGTDKLSFDALTDVTATSGTALSAGAKGAITDDSVYVATTDGTAANLTTGGADTITDFTDAGDVEDYIAERFDFTAANDDNGVIILNDSNSGNAHVYTFNDAVADNTAFAVDGSELTYIGVITGAVIAAGDIA